MHRACWYAAFAALALLATDPAAAQKRSLVVANATADAGKLDPHLTAVGADKGMLNWVFNALVRIRPGQINPEFIEPDLAESWTSNADKTEWVFKIRKGVLCHGNYGEFTAADAAYSLQRAADKARSSFAGDMAPIASVEAVDASTLKVTLKQPIPSLLGLLSNYHGGMMVCKKAAEELGEGFARKPIGTGPFMFVEYQPQQFVKLAANKAFFRGAPQIDEITYRYMPSDATRDLALQNGELDLVFGRQVDQWVQRMRSVKGLKVLSIEPAELNALHLNIKAKPLDDIRVRQAIAHAIDRKAMVALLGTQVSREAVSVIPDSNLGTAKLTLPEYDVAKAKKLLAEAGYPDGLTIKAIISTHPTLSKIMEGLQAQLKQAGITLDMQPVDHPTWHQQIRKDLSPVVMYQAFRFPVADSYLSQFYYSPSSIGQPTAITNFSHCDVADAEIEAARKEPDLAKQKALWKTAQEKVLAAVCAVPFSESLQVWAQADTFDLGYDMVGSLNLVPDLTEKSRFTK
jgi:peptide/nickel transport system substrate-binding protein